MIKTFFAFVKLDFKLLLRGRVGMFWTLAFPAFMLALQMTFFDGSGSLGEVRLLAVDHDRTAASHDYVDFVVGGFSQQRAVTLRRVQSEQDRPTLSITIPSGFGAAALARHTSRVQIDLPGNVSLASSTALSILKSLTDAYNISLSGQPRVVSLSTTGVREQAPKRNYILYVATGLACMIILSTSLMGFATSVVGARESGMLKAYQLLPAPPGMILWVWTTSRVIMSVAASVLLFIVACLIYGLKIEAGPAYVALAILTLAVGTASFLALGLMIASLSSNLAVATILANCLYFPLLFTGNVMIPTGGLPEGVRDVLGYMPVNQLAAATRALLSAEPGALTTMASALGACAVMTVGSVAVFRRRFDWRPSE
jgi:ABC-2 type transport system permease protein